MCARSRPPPALGLRRPASCVCVCGRAVVPARARVAVRGHVRARRTDGDGGERARRCGARFASGTRMAPHLSSLRLLLPLAASPKCSPIRSPPGIGVLERERGLGIRLRVGRGEAGDERRLARPRRPHKDHLCAEQAIRISRRSSPDLWAYGVSEHKQKSKRAQDQNLIVRGWGLPWVRQLAPLPSWRLERASS